VIAGSGPPARSDLKCSPTLVLTQQAYYDITCIH